MLKLFPSLFGGIRNAFVNSDVSVEVGKLGLQYNIKAA